MKKNNIAKIRSQIWKTDLSRAALLGAVLGAFAVFASLGRHPAYRGYYIGLGVILLIICLIIGIICAVVHSNSVKQRAALPASIPFAEDDLHYVEGSKTIYLGREWLLWKNGLDCQMYPKEMIEMDYIYGERRNGMVKGFMALKLKMYAQPILLMYHFGQEDAVAVINQWLNEEKPADVIDAEVIPEVVYCPYCGTPNKPSARFCGHCGAPLKTL